MNVKEQKKQLNKIVNLKNNNNYDNFKLQDLKKLPTFNGLVELSFKNKLFYMINIENDDAVPLKYLWRNKYENFSLNLWYDITRKDGYFFDVGAHTGIYSIIGNLDKNKNNIISIEPFYINYSRLLSNLKLNKITPGKCFLAAASNSESVGKFKAKTLFNHSTGGAMSEQGTLSVSKIKIDNFKLEKKICGMKIDTEGHELEVLERGIVLIERDKPDIIFEINENCFDKCLGILKTYGYKFYFVDEINEKLTNVNQFSSYFTPPEGSNCYATIKQI